MFMADRHDLSELSDESLMEQICMGNHEAFSVLVYRYSKMFYAAAYRVCSHSDEAEDIVQDAFLKLWNNPSAWEATKGAKFTTWFYKVVTNTAVDAMRKKKNHKGDEAFEFIADTRGSQLQTMEDGEQQKVLEQVIMALPERQRLALNLCFYEGLSNREAADIIGVGVKGVESLLMRAKTGIKDELIRRGLFSDKFEEKKKGHKYA